MSFVNFNIWRIKKMASYCIETGLIVLRRNGGRLLVEDRHHRLRSQRSRPFDSKMFSLTLTESVGPASEPTCGVRRHSCRPDGLRFEVAQRLLIDTSASRMFSCIVSRTFTA